MNKDTLKERIEDWEIPFKEWYLEPYPTNWKAPVVVEKIKEILEQEREEYKKELVEMIENYPTPPFPVEEGLLNEVMRDGALIGFEEAKRSLINKINN